MDGLLATKFYNPQIVGHLTERPRLDVQLDESLSTGCRLVMVTAPAGFGKSTLVSAWIRRQSTPYSWLSLDTNENEPRLFLSYLVGALQKIDPSLGASQVNRIQTAETADSEAIYLDVLAVLVNEMALLPNAFYLVLDDCHVLKNPSLHRLLNFLIEHQPSQLHLILLTREDLPLPVSRLRVRRQMIEIRQIDLQFTTRETEDFLSTGMGITRLTGQDIQALEQRTEGWIAGLQLAALSLAHEPDPARFIQSFTGSDRYILDYLLEEVFSHQPAEIKHFLLATSLLDRFCAPLCDTLLQAFVDQAADFDGRSLAILEQVEHAHLFLIPLDNQRQWYRYHHLFADLLRHALKQASPDKVQTLHLRASQWLEAHGFIQEAAKHAFLSQDWVYAAELVECHAWNVILHSQVAMVSEWCSNFPEGIIRKRPALCIFHGWALVIAFKKDNAVAANARLEQAEATLADISPETCATLLEGSPPVRLHNWVTGHITLLRSYLLMMIPRRQADPQALTDLGQLAYDRLPAEDISSRSASLLDICYALQARSDAEEAGRQFEYVVGVALSGGNYFGAVAAEYHRAHGLFAQGRLRDVVAFCRQKRQSYAAHFEHPFQDLPVLALLDQAMGYALLEMNELDEAERLLTDGLKVGQWMPREELPGYLALARLYYAKGEAQGTADTLRRLDLRWPDIHYCVQAMRILYALKFQPVEKEAQRNAVQWAAENRPDVGPGILLPGIGPAWNSEADYVVYTAWAQIQILLGQAPDALVIIQPMLDLALQYHLNHRVIDLSLLQAQAHAVEGQKDKAWKPLGRALALAEKEGYLRLADQGPVLVGLLGEAARQGIAPRYIQRNLANLHPCFSQSPLENVPEKQAPAAYAFDLDGLLEPLSSREIEILALMARGLSHPEIAARLYLSLNTLKAHARNIYGKLDVHSRGQAINKARELKII